jgi:5-methylcytosine-specific restriction endonuclease McrA
MLINPETGLKCCSYCKTDLPPGDFNKCAHWPDGLQNNCRPCQKKMRDAKGDQNRSRCREWYQANKEYAILTAKKWQAEHPELVQEIKHKSREKYRHDPEHKARRIQQALAHARRNPEQRNAIGASYRARKKQAKGSFTTQEWKDKLVEFNHHCAYCHKPFDKEHRPTQDHMMPLSKGGTHEYSNIVPACRSCNSRKKDRFLLTFAQELFTTIRTRQCS